MDFNVCISDIFEYSISSIDFSVYIVNKGYIKYLSLFWNKCLDTIIEKSVQLI